MRVMFNKPPVFSSRGRNGYIQTAGVEITRLLSGDPADPDVLWLEPITVKTGEVSESCRIALPVDAIGDFVGGLLKALETPFLEEPTDEP